MRILIIGPVGPTIGGDTVSFRAIVNYVESHPSLDTHVLDTNRRTTVPATDVALGIKDFLFFCRLFYRYLKLIRKVDVIFLCANSRFILTAGLPLLGIAKICNRKTFVKPFGGSLHLYRTQNFSSKSRWSLFLRLTDVLLPQTEVLKNQLERFIAARRFSPVVLKFPNFHTSRFQAEPSISYRSRDLVYLGQMRPEKGVVELCKFADQFGFSLDLAGPLVSGYEELVLDNISKTRNARYCGIVDPEDVVEFISQRKIFVFASRWYGEGMPGVLLRALAAGCPIISFSFDSIDELIVDGSNGFIVNNFDEMKIATQKLLDDESLWRSISKNNLWLSQRYFVDDICSKVFCSCGLL